MSFKKAIHTFSLLTFFILLQGCSVYDNYVKSMRYGKPIKQIPIKKPVKEEANTPDLALNHEGTPATDKEMESSTQYNELANKVMALEEQVSAITSDWNEVKPGFERLVKIEGDLKLLISALNELPETPKLESEEQKSEVAESELITDESLQTNTTIVEPIPQTEAPKEIAKLTPKEKPNSFTLQLAAVTEFGSVSRSWSALKRLYGPVLNTLSPGYEEVRSSGKTFYRLKAGEFANRSDAVASCKALAQLGGQCVVVKSQGINQF